MNKFDKIYKFKYFDPKTRIITKCDARNSLRYGKFISIMKILKILKSKIGNKKILFEINDNELFYNIAIKRKDYWKKKIKYKKVDIMENLNYQLSESCIEIEEVINEKIQETEVRLKYNEINKAEKTVLEMVFLNMEKVIKELEFGNSDIISYEIYISLISRRRDEGYRELMCSEILNNIILEYMETLK